MRLLILLFFPLAGLWIATQDFAKAIHYDTVYLGQPLFIWQQTKLYPPWSFIPWYRQYYAYVPKLFNEASIYIYIMLFLMIVLLALLKPQRKYTSHGTAHWADYNDLLKMDLVSSNGVIIGLWDKPLYRKLTSLVHGVELIKKEKSVFKEREFNDKVSKWRIKVQDRIALYTQLLPKVESKKQIVLNKRIKILNKSLEVKREYEPWQENDFVVWFWAKLHECLFNVHKRLPHFYLKDNSDRHLAVIAPTRSGKGVGLIIPTLLGSWNSSVLINDIKSENYSITAGYRKKMGQTVIKFEPTATDGSSARWNPLEEITIGSPSEVSMAQNLASIIADYDGSGKGDYWITSASNAITAVILFLKYAHCADPTHYPTEPTLFDVASFLKANIVPAVDKNGHVITETDAAGKKQEKVDAKGFIDTLRSLQNFEHVPDTGISIREWNTAEGNYVYRQFMPSDLKDLYSSKEPLKTTWGNDASLNSLDHMPNTHPIIFQLFSEIISKPANECGSVVSTANTALKEYLDPILAMNTSQSDFSVDDLMNHTKPVSLYLITPPSDLLRLSPIFRLFFELTVRKHTKKIADYKNGRANVIYKHKLLLLMDEFSSLGNLKSFSASLSHIAGYGIKAFLIIQGLPQINSIYGKDNHIFMNCGLQIFFSPNDNETAKYAESLLGNKTITVTSVTDNGWWLSRKRYAKSQISRALMTADELKRLQSQEIIALADFPCILASKVKYYENKLFTDCLCDAPIVSDVIRNNPNQLRDSLIAKAQTDKEALNSVPDKIPFKYKE